MPYTEEEKLKLFKNIYTVLSIMEETNPESISATASLRLLLIDEFGEEEQRRIVGEWNRSIASEYSKEINKKLMRQHHEGLQYLSDK